MTKAYGQTMKQFDVITTGTYNYRNFAIGTRFIPHLEHEYPSSSGRLITFSHFSDFRRTHEIWQPGWDYYNGIDHLVGKSR